MTPGPDSRKCTAYLLAGPGGMPLGLGLNEGLGITGRDARGVESLAYPQVSRYLEPSFSWAGVADVIVMIDGVKYEPAKAPLPAWKHGHIADVFMNKTFEQLGRESDTWRCDTIDIIDRVAEINAVVAEIAASAEQQASGLQEVNTAVDQMDQVTQQNAAMVEEATAATRTLTQQSTELAQIVSRFTTVASSMISHAEESQARHSPVPRAPVRKPAKQAAAGGGAARAAEPDAAWEEF